MGFSISTVLLYFLHVLSVFTIYVHIKSAIFLQLFLKPIYLCQRICQLCIALVKKNCLLCYSTILLCYNTILLRYNTVLLRYSFLILIYLLLHLLYHVVYRILIKYFKRFRKHNDHLRRFVAHSLIYINLYFYHLFFPTDSHTL